MEDFSKKGISDNVSGKSSRIIYFDVLRILSAIAVVIVHVCAGYILSVKDTWSINYIFPNILSSLARFAVPSFFMISGALLLNEKKPFSIKRFFKKNLLNIIFVLFFWAFVYGLVNQIIIPLTKGESLSIREIVLSFFIGEFHLWFLYVLIGLYLIVPFLRFFVNVKNKNLVLYFILLSLIFQFFEPILEILSNKHDIFKGIMLFLKMFKLQYVLGYTAYFLLGWYVVNEGIPKKLKPVIYVLGCLSVVAIVLHNQFYPSEFDNIISNQNILVLFYTVTVFDAVKTLCEKKKKREENQKVQSSILLDSVLNTKKEKMKSEKIISKISSLTFGVYVLHIFFLNLLEFLFPNNGINVVLYIFIEWSIICILSFFATYILSKIPFLKKTVRK